jgi:hypothetical protein
MEEDGAVREPRGGARRRPALVAIAEAARGASRELVEPPEQLEPLRSGPPDSERGGGGKGGAADKDAAAAPAPAPLEVELELEAGGRRGSYSSLTPAEADDGVRRCAARAPPAPARPAPAQRGARARAPAPPTAAPTPARRRGTVWSATAHTITAVIGAGVLSLPVRRGAGARRGRASLAPRTRRLRPALTPDPPAPRSRRWRPSATRAAPSASPPLR